MYLSNSGKHLLLDALDAADWVGLHTAFSTTGGNEASGGGYGRAAATWDAAGGTVAGRKDLDGTLPSIAVAAGTYVYFSLWDSNAAGTFYGMQAIGGGSYLPFAAETGDLSGDTLFCEAHGYANGTTVIPWGDLLPTGLTEGTVYYVVGASTDTFQLATTLGGSAINITDEGFGLIQSCLPQTYTSAGLVNVAGLAVDLGGVT